MPLQDHWYHWAGAPIGITYARADAMVSEAVERLEANRDALADGLRGIVDAAIKHGVNDEVGAAIAHAELLARQQGFLR